LGKAWELHRQQDISSHPEFSYVGLADMIPKDSIMLLSGGLDSFIQWRLLGQPKAVYFMLGHRSQAQELEKISLIKEKFNGDITIDESLDSLTSEMTNGYIPYRNLLFILASTRYGSNIIIGQIAEWAPDKNHSFYRQVEKLLRNSTTGKFQGVSKRIRIYAPFSSWTKTELVREYIRHCGTANDLTTYTTSCYKDSFCGTCTACVSRFIAMQNNGLEEHYEVNPDLQLLTSKLSLRDFKFYNLAMYWKRWREIQYFKKRGGNH